MFIDLSKPWSFFNFGQSSFFAWTLTIPRTLESNCCGPVAQQNLIFRRQGWAERRWSAVYCKSCWKEAVSESSPVRAFAFCPEASQVVAWGPLPEQWASRMVRLPEKDDSTVKRLACFKHAFRVVKQLLLPPALFWHQNWTHKITNSLQAAMGKVWGGEKGGMIWMSLTRPYTTLTLFNECNTMTQCLQGETVWKYAPLSPFMWFIVLKLQRHCSWREVGSWCDAALRRLRQQTFECGRSENTLTL